LYALIKTEMKSEKNKYAAKVVLFYLIFGVIWIVFSDLLVTFISKLGIDITFLQTVKGVTFILVTSYLLFKLIERYLAKVEEEANKAKKYTNTANIILASVNTDGDILFINDKGAEILGCNASECIGKSFLNLIPPNERSDLQTMLEDVFTGKKQQTGFFETKVNTSKQKEVVISWSCNVLKDSKGNIQGAICCGEDVTARTFAEKTAVIFKYVVEQSPNSVVITDVNGNIQYVNQKFIELTGYNFEEVLGKNPKILKSGKTPPEVYPELWKRITAGETWEGEFCNRKKNGELYWEYAKISPIKDPKTGKIINFLGIKEDITYEKKLEAELLHAQKMEAVGNLAGGVAHDFNNILTAIIGYGNVLLLKLKESDPLRYYVEQILSSSERAASLTQKLLTFARKQPVSKKVINLNDTIKNLTKLLERIIGENIEFKTILSYEKDLNVYADTIQIEQVLMNLASNAKDAMSDGGFFMIETTHFYMDDAFIKEHGFGRTGEYAVLKVTDTGCGIDKDILPYIFEPFYTTKEVGKGTGLGLSIVYGIVKSHDGFITVESELNKGTTFSIYLPITKKPLDNSKITHLEKITISGNETVLVAEDDKAVLQMIKEYFENYGYKVFTATNGDEAISVFNEHKGEIAVCLLDVVMPKKSGIEAYKEIKILNPSIKAIIMSGYATELNRHKDEFWEGTLFIQKPVSPNELIKMTRELLDK